MNEMREVVALPDPAVRPMLHPTDLAEARADYLRAWWFARLSSPPVVVLLAVVVWVVTGNLVPAVLAPASTAVVGLLGSRWHEARAWDYIPRRRQDPRGGAPWRAVATVVDAVALVAAAVAAIVAARQAGVPDGVVAYTVGSGAGVVLLQAGELVVASARRAGRSALVRRALTLASVAAASFLAAVLAMTGGWDRAAVQLAVAGLSTIVAVQAAWWLTTHLRRPPADSEA